VEYCQDLSSTDLREEMDATIASVESGDDLTKKKNYAIERCSVRMDCSVFK
jgi:hypothetical protein